MNSIGRNARVGARTRLSAWRLLFATFAFAAAALSSAPTARADFATDCDTGCHTTGAGPTGGYRINAANAPDVITAADAVWSMYGAVPDIVGIAGEIASALGSLTQAAANVNYGSNNNNITVAKIAVAGSSVLTTLERVSGPTSVSFTANSNSLSYDHTATNCNNQTLVVRGTDGGGVVTANRTIPITVNAPSAPVAVNDTTTINYSTGNTNINLRTIGAVSGTAGLTNVTLGALSPNVGTRTATGPETLDYAASSTVHASTVTLTFTINGPCGTTSTPRQLTINVNDPPAPATSNRGTLAIPIIVPAGGPFNFDLTSNITGVTQSSPAVTYNLVASQPTAPGSGTTSVAGNVVTYDPGAYVGTTTFTFTKEGPGGTSNTSTVFIDVTAAPVVTPASATTAFNTAVPVNLAANITSSQPVLSVTPSAATNGTALATGPTTITFTPTAGFFGTGSFQYTATNAGGTSTTPALVTVTVNPPPATVAATAVTVPYNSGAPVASTTIDLAPFIGPVGATVISVNPSGATNGTVVATGPTTVSFTPTAGYIGAASFQYTATNAGGTSAAPATVSITVSAPPPPVTASLNFLVSATMPTTLDLSPGISGLVNTVSIVSTPAAGSVALAGNMATYTPLAGFTGTASFTYRATGPGGNSTPGTVTLTYTAAPVTSDRTLTVPHNGSAVIDLTSAFSGLVTSYSISRAPVNGSVVMNGPLVTYTANQNYFGPDTFQFTAVGPGGTSVPGTVRVTVNSPIATLGALEIATPFNTPITFDLAAAVTAGAATSFEVSSAPTGGRLVISGTMATYTPNAGFSGVDNFRVIAVNATGRSDAGTIRVNVGTLAPRGTVATLRLAMNGQGILDLGPLITGSGITGIAIVTLAEHGIADVEGTKIVYTPKTGYFGTDTFEYVAFGNAGRSPPSRIVVVIEGRPDPTTHANLMAIVGNQAELLRRFGRAQIDNVTRRLEALHKPGPADPASRPDETPPAQKPASLSTPPPVASGIAPAGNADPRGAASPKRTANPWENALANGLSSVASARSLNFTASTDGTRFSMPLDGLNFWTGGTARFGTRTLGESAGAFRFSTDGLTVGVDKRLNDRLALGAALGYARDEADIGDDGSRSKAKGESFSLYGSFHPTPRTYVDALLGFGRADLDSDRWVDGFDAFARANRRADQVFASVAAGYEYRKGSFLVSPYGRIDLAEDRLKRVTESGAGVANLVFEEQTLRTTSAALGVRLESAHETDYGRAMPRARLEYRRDFDSGRAASFTYADQLGSGLTYSATPSGTGRNALILGVGSDFLLRGGWRVGVDYQGERNSGTGTTQAVRFLLSKTFDDGMPVPGGWSMPLRIPVNVDFGIQWDDNVFRGRLDDEIRSDRIYTFNASRQYEFPLNKNARVLATALFTVDKPHTWTGLGRFSGGAEAQVQYRASGDFDAITFAAYARGAYDEYESRLRSGPRYTVGVNARRALTDRIDLFADLSRNVRNGKSRVFETRDWAGRVNLDYALGKRGTLYASGEYRKGDIFSTGFPSLANAAIADVFVQDDAVDSGEFFAYRFDGKTVIGTLGWNLPLGTRDAIDLSFRRVRSTPSGRIDFDDGARLRYDVNQYSLLYLLRF